MGESMPFSVTESLMRNWRGKLPLFAQHYMSQLGHAVMVKNDIDGCSGSAQHIDHPRTGCVHDAEAVRSIQDTCWGGMESWNWFDRINQPQEIENWLDSNNGFAQNVAVAVGRAMDLAVIHAMNASVRAGKKGEIIIEFPNAQRIAAGFDGMSMGKLREASRMLRSAQLCGITEQWYIGLTARQLDHLLANTKRYSPDHAAARALVKGETNRFLGFEFIHCEQLPKIGTIRSVFAWMKSGICLGIGNDIGDDTESTVDNRSCYSHAQKIHTGLCIGAVRLAEAKVVQIDCWDGE